MDFISFSVENPYIEFSIENSMQMTLEPPGKLQIDVKSKLAGLHSRNFTQ